MINPRSRLRRKNEDVVAKVMDGEAIIINLATGIYYSMSDVGGVIWELLDAGCSIDAIAAAVAARYDIDELQARNDAAHLVEHLVREGVLSTTDEAASPLPTSTSTASTKLVYAAPELSTYTDMEDLLALDPPTPGFNDIPWKG